MKYAFKGLALLVVIGSQSRADDAEKVFTAIYESKQWIDRSNKESDSGPGSTRGDFNWMRMVNLRNYLYGGFDVVEALVKKNNLTYSAPNISFYKVDLNKEVLPVADIILCRDTLSHLPLKDAFEVLRNFKKSKSKYLLITTYPDTDMNADINDLGENFKMGDWRFINLCKCKPPFNLPEPIELITEGCNSVHTQYKGKSLGLWRLADINV